MRQAKSRGRAHATSRGWAVVREALQAAGEAGPAEIARRFRRARATTVAPLLDTLAALGHARATADGRFAA